MALFANMNDEYSQKHGQKSCLHRKRPYYHDCGRDISYSEPNKNAIWLILSE